MGLRLTAHTDILLVFAVLRTVVCLHSYTFAVWWAICCCCLSLFYYMSELLFTANREHMYIFFSVKNAFCTLTFGVCLMWMLLLVFLCLQRIARNVYLLQFHHLNIFCFDISQSVWFSSVFIYFIVSIVTFSAHKKAFEHQRKRQ